MGMRQIRPKVTHPENVGKSKREMKPREMAMMTAVATRPAEGCFMSQISYNRKLRVALVGVNPGKRAKVRERSSLLL